LNATLELEDSVLSVVRDTHACGMTLMSVMSVMRVMPHNASSCA